MQFVERCINMRVEMDKKENSIIDEEHKKELMKELTECWKLGESQINSKES